MAGRSLHHLSPELRLEIYRHVVYDCLADSSPADLAGLFFSCRNVHDELEADFVCKVRQLLDIQSKWNKACGDRIEPTPFRLQVVHHELGTKTGLTRLHIFFPALCPKCADLREVHLVYELLALIKPLLCARWEELTITLCSRSHAVRLNHDPWLFHRSMDYSQKSPLEAFYSLTRTKCLVVNYGHADDRIHIDDIGSFWLSRYYTRYYGPDPLLMPTLRCGWVTRELHRPRGEPSWVGRPGWRITFDFEADRGTVQGALWQISERESAWQVKRLSDDMEDYGGAEFFSSEAIQYWELEYTSSEEDEEINDTGDVVSGDDEVAAVNEVSK